MFQINDTKNRIWTLLCGFCLSKTQISTSKYTKICFKSMKQNRVCYMYFANVAICYVDFAYHKKQISTSNYTNGFCKPVQKIEYAIWILQMLESVMWILQCHIVFFIMIVAKYRNVSSCFWYCKIQKKIAAMQKREQKTDSRNASKKLAKS